MSYITKPKPDDWSYTIGLVIPLDDGGEIEMWRHGIRSETDLIFMVGVIRLKLDTSFLIRIHAARKPSVRAPWERKTGQVVDGQIVWSAKS